MSFPAGGSGNGLKWAVAFALLVDVPFLAIVLLGGRTVTATLLILPIALSALIIYSSYAAGRMKYILDEDGVRVSFPLSPLRVSYGKIKSAGKVETTLSFRLFGGSLPGAHWGRFTTSLGNAQVYATRYTGEFVLLELSDTAKILISPLDPDAFVEALRAKATFTAPTLTDVAELRLDKRLAAAQIVAVSIAWLALVAYVTSIYPGLPDVIPVHFGFDGVPNRYGSKVELLILVAFSAIFPAMNAAFALKFSKYNKGMSVFLGVLFLLAIGLFAFVVNQMASAI